MKSVAARVLCLCLVAALAGCSSDRDAAPQGGWTDDEVTFTADGLTLHGTYHHRSDTAGPAALLISESGRTDRNGDNAVAGPVGNMRQLADLLAQHDVATLRYDKLGTGSTGLGPFAQHPADVGLKEYTSGAAAALRFLTEQPGTDRNRVSIYGLGEGAIHAMALASDTSPSAPRVHALALLQPLPARYLDIITERVRAEVDPAAMTQWLAAVDQIRTKGTVPAQLPQGLSAIANPGNIKAVIEADQTDPLALAARVPAGTPVLLTCSDSDGQARCSGEHALIGALDHTALTVAQLDGVNHVLRHDPSDNVANYAKQDPLSPQLVEAIDGFVTK